MRRSESVTGYKYPDSYITILGQYNRREDRREDVLCSVDVDLLSVSWRW